MISPAFHSQIIPVPPRHSAERHWRPPFGGDGPQHGGFLCRLGTQPKGIGDWEFTAPFSQAVNAVPPRHSAERHWRLCPVPGYRRDAIAVPPRHSAERHWRLFVESGGFQSNGAGAA